MCSVIVVESMLVGQWFYNATYSKIDQIQEKISSTQERISDAHKL